MDDFPIVDPHHHLWDLERFSYPWLSGRPLPSSVAGDVAPIAKSYLLDDYLADTANQNVVKSVHVDAGFDSSQPVEESRWLRSCCWRLRHSLLRHCLLREPWDPESFDGHHSGYQPDRDESASNGHPL